MYVYNGKLEWYDLVQNECITIVFPAGFALKDPVCAYWQWTKDDDGKQKTNCTQLAAISSVTKTSEEYKVSFSFSYYSFDGVLSSDLKSISVTMRNPDGETSPTVTLQAQLSDACRVPTTEVFTGKLDWDPHAINEMITLVVPCGLTGGAPVGLYYQWTSDGQEQPKVNSSVNSTFRDVFQSVDGQPTGRFDDGYYIYDVTIPNNGTGAKIHMSNPDGRSVTVDMQRSDFRQSNTKRALLVRFGTGTSDNGIFLVRDMLTMYLGFAPSDIEMLYFDSEPQNAPGVISGGQRPPTVETFQWELIRKLCDSKAGDVCFLYVDAPGTNENADGSDEGWKLAQDDAGLRSGVTGSDWVAEAIRAYTPPGVNVTILTSACKRGGILGMQTATSGVVLAGCHETQFSVKALPTEHGMVDPWVYAIVATIKNQVTLKRGVPTYTTLFNEAKKFIKMQVDGGAISGKKYKGPSPNELSPIVRDQVLKTSNQDPQLIFFSGYLDPNEERFLFPFVAPRGGQAEGQSVRFPKDEYPHVNF